MSRVLELEQGKYRFHEESHILKCDRNGQPWRSFLGDKATWCLFDRCLELQDHVRVLEAKIAQLMGVPQTKLVGAPTTAAEVKDAMQGL